VIGGRLRAAVLVVGLVTCPLAGAGEPDCALPGRVEELLALDRWQEALAEARAVHEARPASANARAGLGEAQFRAGRLAEAEALLAPIAEDAAACGTELAVLGLLRAAAGRHEEAVALMDRAVAVAPDEPRVLLRAAEVVIGRARAIELLERYLAHSAGEDPDRIEAARGAIDTHRALGDREAWVLERAPERIELPLQLIGAQGRLAAAVVRVDLGDPPRPVRLLLDTGSPGLFLVSRVARKRGFEPLVEATAFGGGGDQRHKDPRGIFPRFALGELVYRNALATTTEYELDATGRWHGVLGLAIFEGYLAEIDLERGRLRLERADVAGRTVVDAMRFWTVSGQMLVEARARDGEPGLFLFDTGASVSVLDLAYAGGIEGVDVRKPAGMSSYGGPLAEARMAEGARVQLGALDSGAGPLRATDLSLRSRIGGVELRGFVGLDVLGGRRWLVDWSARTLRRLD
jgi:tetratricopeptide (TPR) repeat protein